MAGLILPVIYSMLQLIVFVALGVFIGKKKFWENSIFQGVNKFLIRFALPAFLFSRIIKTDVDFLRNSLIFPLTAFVTISGGMLIGYLVARLVRINKSEARVISAISGFGNSGYLPLTLLEILPVSLPLIVEKFGDVTPALYVGTFVLVFSPYFWSVGNYLVTGSKTRLRVSDFITPPFIGVMLAFLVLISGFQTIMLNEKLPFVYLVKAAERLGNVTFPMVLINLGALISSLDIRRQKSLSRFFHALIPALIRFLILPGIFFLVFFTILKPNNIAPAISWVLFLECFTPPATNFSVMAGRAPDNVELISYTLLVTHIIYLVLFPATLLFFLTFS
ncbi:MAG: AEC family transporter [Spirochaetales bacterium]|nr:AEC family transporter [Spirochaetales bacterium]